MGPKVVGIVASPRKGGNTDTLISQALAGARAEGAETDVIYLNDLSIRPCQACAEYPAPAYCSFQDGMERVYEAIDTADALVIGTPRDPSLLRDRERPVKAHDRPLQLPG